MRVATYNIQSADYGKSIDAINKEITDLGIQIIGFQEVDNMAKRSGGVNVLTEICKDNFPFCEYGATMEFDGGHYGIGIASVYPMKHVKTIHYETADLEPRILMLCEVDVDGKKLYVANTHLSYEDTDIRKKQMEVLAAELKGFSPVILFGDFNVGSFEEYAPLTMKKVNNAETSIKSFKGPISFRCIDNIFYDDGVEVKDFALNESKSSDHNMIRADIEIK